MYKILIVEDDLGIARAVEERIVSWDMQAKCVTDFRNVLAEFVLCTSGAGRSTSRLCLSIDLEDITAFLHAESGLCDSGNHRNLSGVRRILRRGL